MPLSTFCARCREAAVRVQRLCVVPASVTASGFWDPRLLAVRPQCPPARPLLSGCVLPLCRLSLARTEVCRAGPASPAPSRPIVLPSARVETTEFNLERFASLEKS